jgi:hypothetical protein
VSCILWLLATTGCRHIYAPQPPGTITPPLQVQPSHIAVTATVPISVPQIALNNAIPQREDADDYTVSINGGADNCGSGASVGYHIHRDPIILSGVGNTLSAQTNIAYNAIGRGKPKLIFGICGPLFSASCGRGEPEPHLKVDLSASIDGINPNWTPKITFHPASVQPDGACKLSIFNVHVENNIAGFAQNAINNSEGNAQTGLANSLDLPEKANRAWRALESPIKVTPSVWLSVHPQEIGILPFTATPSAITAGMQLSALPVLQYGDQPPASDVQPLPTPKPLPASNSYFISMPVQTDYSIVEKSIEDALKIHNGGIRYPPTGKNYVTVTGVDVYAYGAAAVVRLDLKIHGIFGPSATVYLSGTPTFNTLTNTISFPDLDFTADSKNILLRIAIWLEQGAFRDDLRSRASFDLTPYVVQARRQVLKALNQDIGQITLFGTVDAVNILGVYTSPEDQTFKAYLQTSGTINAALH